MWQFLCCSLKQLGELRGHAPHTCSKKGTYHGRFATVVLSIIDLTDSASSIQTLKYVSILRPQDILLVLIYFELWLKEILLVRIFWFRKEPNLFVNWHCVETFWNQTYLPQDMFFPALSWCSVYVESRVGFARTKIVFVYYSTFAI